MLNNQAKTYSQVHAAAMQQQQMNNLKNFPNIVQQNNLSSKANSRNVTNGSQPMTNFAGTATF